MTVKTAREALELSLPIWKDLSENGNNLKPRLFHYLFCCPCCEYVFRDTGDTETFSTTRCVMFCPIKWPWFEHKSGSVIVNGEYIPDPLCHSIYYEFVNAETVDDRKIKATKIYNLIKTSLENLNE
jgi:hypothetical protein